MTFFVVGETVYKVTSKLPNLPLGTYIAGAVKTSFLGI